MRHCTFRNDGTSIACRRRLLYAQLTNLVFSWPYHLQMDLRCRFIHEDSITDVRSPVCTRVLQSYRFVYFKGISGACSFYSLSLST